MIVFTPPSHCAHWLQMLFPSIDSLTSDYCRLVTSPKSTDCTSGYRMTKFLLNHFIDPTLVQLSVFSRVSLSQGEDGRVSLIKCLLAVLRDHVMKGGRSLVRASLTAPMYGVIQAIRSVLEEMNIRSYSYSIAGVIIVHYSH